MSAVASGLILAALGAVLLIAGAYVLAGLGISLVVAGAIFLVAASALAMAVARSSGIKPNG